MKKLIIGCLCGLIIGVAGVNSNTRINCTECGELFNVADSKDGIQDINENKCDYCHGFEIGQERLLNQ